MRHNPELDAKDQDRCRVDITYLQRSDPMTGERGKITRTDDIMLTLDEGKELEKKIRGGK